MDDEALRLLVHSFITSRLNYCNGFLRTAAWLSVESTTTANREQCCAVLATLHHCYTDYTGWRLMFDVHAQLLCISVSSVSLLVAVTFVCDRLRAAILRHDGQGRALRISFAVARPAAWNSLPALNTRNIDSHSAFYRDLKTYLFTVLD